MTNPFGWIEIYVADMDRAQKFYETVLQVKLTDLTMPWDTGDTMKMLAFPSDMNGFGCSGALVRMDGVNPGGWGTLAYFSCEDCTVLASRVAFAWGTIIQEKMSIGQYGFIAIVVDTESNMIGFHSMK